MPQENSHPRCDRPSGLDAVIQPNAERAELERPSTVIDEKSPQPEKQCLEKPSLPFQPHLKTELRDEEKLRFYARCIRPHKKMLLLGLLYHGYVATAVARTWHRSGDWCGGGRFLVALTLVVHAFLVVSAAAARWAPVTQRDGPPSRSLWLAVVTPC